ncbi:MAG: hypothetical protein WDO14_22115 [Bacteroidota bacterium]
MAPIIETAISLLFVFLVFSLINSWIVEYVSMQLQRRGKFLYEFMIRYMDDKFNKNWGLMLYSHPLLEVLHREITLSNGLFSIFRNYKLKTKRRLPAYVPSDQLASAMIDLIVKHDKVPLFVKKKDSEKIEYVNPDNELTVEEREKMSGDRDTYLFNEFLDGLNRLKESEMKTTLTSIARKIDSKTSDKVNQLNTMIATWFDSSMERLNGWYKRETRSWLFFTGLIIAIVFNVNTLNVVQRLYTDPQARATITKAAEQYIESHKEFVKDSATDNIDTLRIRIDALKGQLSPLPFGWGDQLDKYPVREGNIIDLYVVRPFKLFKDNFRANWLGWLITGLALSFGAPFWFDVLKKFINVRSAGLIPSTAKEDSSQKK